MGMRDITVIIDRADGSNVKTTKAQIVKVIAALEPLGVRIRVTRSKETLIEDKAWKRKGEPRPR
jgi:hypothetical protein